VHALFRKIDLKLRAFPFITCKFLQSILAISCSDSTLLRTEAAEAFQKWRGRGALAKRGTFVYDQNQTILCRSRAERKYLKIWSLYNVGNGLSDFGVFTTSKKLVYFLSSKRGQLIQTQKKDTFFTFKKVGGAHAPIPPPRFRGPYLRTRIVREFPGTGGFHPLAKTRHSRACSI
jgi:hypothetical protein